MDKIVKQFSSSKGMKRNDDDFADRLNNRYTVVILVAFAVVVTMFSYVGKPITCWAPKHFSGGWTKYANNYCWVRNTYYLPYKEHIPREDEHHEYILYYQWVPFILLAQAAFFHLPSIVWHGLNQKAGVDADNVLAAAHTLSRTKEPEKRDAQTKLITMQLDRFLRNRRTNEKRSGFSRLVDVITCSWISRRLNSYLVILFLFTKLLYIANVVVQFLALGVILKTNFTTFASDYFNILRVNDYYDINPVFPRVTMCDFNVRFLGNVQRYTVQCVLPINLFTEKMYLFLYVWMLFLVVFTSVSFLTWLVRAIIRPDRMGFVRNHVKADELEAKGMRADDDLLGKFLDDYLKQDGAFLLRLIAHNTNFITTSDITNSLFRHFKKTSAIRSNGTPVLDTKPLLSST